MSVCLSTRGVPSVVVRTSVILGAVMPTPRWAIGGGKTHVVHPRGSRLSGSLAGLRLCIVMHVGSSGGSRGWQGLLGRPSDWGGPANPDQRASAKDPATGRPRWR